MMNNDNILVIVPPRPEYGEFSYSNLYSSPSDCDYPYYNGNGNVDYSYYASAAPTPPPVARVENGGANGRIINDTEGRAVIPAVVEGGGGGGGATVSTTSLSSELSASFTSSAMNAVVGLDSSSFDHPSNGGDGQKRSSIITRDPRNGAFTFHVHAEYDMLLRVQRNLDGHRARGGGANDADRDNAVEESIRLSRRILRSIDDYCMHEQWMYHIGREKGEALSRFLRSCLEGQCRKSVGGCGETGVRRFVCVELGTYCGYSALVLAVTLRQFLLDQQQRGATSPSPQFEFQVYTTEVSTKLLNLARSIFRLAGMEGCITPILVQQQDCVDDREYDKNNDKVSGDGIDAAVVDWNGQDEPDRREKQVSFASSAVVDYCDGQDEQGHQGQQDSLASSRSSSSSPQSLSRVLREQYSIEKIDFLLLDHAKHLYLHDLQNLERSRLIGKGSHVCADNVVFNRLDAYRDHMRQLEQLKIVDDENDSGGGGVVKTRLEEMNLEYSNNLKDGMGEFAFC